MADKPTTHKTPTTTSTKADQKTVEKETEASLATVHKHFNEANEKGHFGERLDPTPLENYTLPGVLAGKPTPETDAEASAEASKATDKRGPVSE